MAIENPVLVEKYRADVLESFHRGVVCLVDSNKQIVYAAGNIHQVCYPRSAMKLFQVIPLIESNAMETFGFSIEELAIMCGSHNAEPEHVFAVESILQKIGLNKSFLRCGAQYPTSRKHSNELIKHSIKPEAIHNNCSGKHAAMLALCVLNQWDLETYWKPEHPLQQLILKVCAEMYDFPAKQMQTALDGCSAPIFSVPVFNQAIGYMQLTNPIAFASKRVEACMRIIDAISKHPFMLAGTGRYCTDMMQITAPAVVGKTGAEGVFCMAFTHQKMGACIKVDDGLMGPQYAIAQRLLEHFGQLNAETLKPIAHYAEDAIQNFNRFDTGKYTAILP